MTGIGFDTFKTQLSRFTDRTINQVLGRQKQAFFNRVGGLIRVTAKRSLRKAPQKKLNELTEAERIRFTRQQRAFRRGRINSRPRRPDKTASRGNPPLLHMKKSPLRELIFFYTSRDKTSVLIGPSSYRNGDLFLLEQHFPFMAPALIKITPTIPSHLAAASGTN